MVNLCHICKKGEVVQDKKMSGMFCTGCGECFELGAFTDDVQYREDERGRFMAVGTTYNVEKGFVNSKFSNHAQFLTSVDNARTILKRYCDKLYLSDSFAQISCGFYQQLLIKKFMNGRRLNVVLAACLYISVRSEGANVILLDISDVSEANVYDIGRYYFQIVRILHFNIQTVDPCEYTIRFVDMLNLGDRSLLQVKKTAIQIRDTANRLVQRMKRDWIHFGRRPSGVCAAAVLVSCRINNVRCTIKDIISIAKVCESTIRKRINEFIATPASKLTFKEFMSQEIDQEEDPPSYKIGDNIEDDTVEQNLDKVERYQEIIEGHLKDSRAKLRGVYAKFLKEILVTQNAEDEKKPILVGDEDTKMFQEAIIDQNLLAVNEKVVAKINNEIKLLTNDNGNPSREEIEYWAEFRPSAKSLGMLKREETKEIDTKASFEDLLNEKLDDQDDDELDAYIIEDESEVSQRQLEWTILNKDYLKMAEEKEIQKRAQLEDADSKSGITTAPKGRKKRKKESEVDAGLEASTTSEAVEAAMKSKSISLNGINLRELFNEDTTQSSNSNSDKSKLIDLLPSEETNNENLNNNALIKAKSPIRTSSPITIDEDAQLVSTFHSYASKPIPDNTKDNLSFKNIEMEKPDKSNQLDDTSENTPKSTIDSQPSTSSTTAVDEVEESTLKRKIPDETDEDQILEDDDYFVDDDDEDELSRIRQRYNMENEDGDIDDYEECGF
ncbi:transcription factor TFIIIB subunit brf1 [Blomia tropicalis]|nr:transcription factor TFIIIB subunit brf1 [Blomia tropicalis]